MGGRRDEERGGGRGEEVEERREGRGGRGEEGGERREGESYINDDIHTLK